MKKVILIVIGLFLLTSLGYCAGVETVKDDNDGNKGYILINTGTKNGNSDIGHWTDISTVPELKGEQGEQGLPGIGIDGKEGYTPIKNVDYFDGKDGINGVGVDGKDGVGIQGLQGDKGDKGEQGKDVDPETVTNLQNEDITLQNNLNTETIERVNGDDFLNTMIDNTNLAVDNHSKTLQNHESRLNNHESRLGKLEDTQFNLRGELKFIREKNFEVGIYSKYNTNSNVCSEVGLSITIGIGNSWTERELESVNKKVSELQKSMEKILQKAGGNDIAVEKTQNKDGTTTFSVDKTGTMKILKKF
jgi:hypothetical protein